METLKISDILKPKSRDDILKEISKWDNIEIKIMKAIKERNSPLIDMLLKLKIINKDIINFKEYGNQTMLHIASYYGFYNLTKFLIKNNADINLKNIYGNDALYFAIKAHQTNIVELLLKNGAKINKKHLTYNKEINKLLKLYNGK